MNPTLRRYFLEYEDSHRHPTNRLTHKFAIPLIVFHVLVMFDWLQIPGTTFTTIAGNPYGLSVGHLFFAAVMIWYTTLNVKLAAFMLIAFLPCFYIGAHVPWQGVVGIAIGAWIVQLAGHVIWEKRSPAFLTNLLQALVGPLFFVALLTGDWKLEPPTEKMANST
jgi:uncharacterized membrane protein YGL010W